MVTKGELGRPVGRLREQMEKLQLHSSHRSEGKADMLEQQLAMAGERVRSEEQGSKLCPSSNRRPYHGSTSYSQSENAAQLNRRKDF